jgi:flagella basal body P-ring formation protein FlgA
MNVLRLLRVAGGTTLANSPVMKALTTFLRRIMMSKRQRMSRLLPALCGLGYTGLVSAQQTLPEQLIDTTQGFLEFTVEDYLRTVDIPGRYEIQVNRLDPRLRLPFCDQELNAKLESPAQPVGRVSVRVSCEGSAPWSVFVPAQVKVFRDVVVVKRPLTRGSIIGEGDVALAERDTGALGQAFLVTTGQAVGSKLTRPVVADQVILLTSLEKADVIAKGDHVVIKAQSGAINVNMPGEAMSAGAPGEQIRVRNLQSQRVIKARVTAPGVVEVAM